MASMINPVSAFVLTNPPSLSTPVFVNVYLCCDTSSANRRLNWLSSGIVAARYAVISARSS